MDVVGSAVALILLSPLLGAVAAAVKLLGGPGPVIYRGNRIGRLGETFDMLKFRSMRLASDRGMQLTAENDARVTNIGAFLRATKLDELPQFWNVLRGDMSLVGPRPEAPQYISHYKAEHLRLLLLRPGITGAVALEYRNESRVLAEIDECKREAFYLQQLLPQQLDVELEYMDNWSRSRDVELLLRTFVSIFTGIRLGSRFDEYTTRSPGLVRRLARSTVPLVMLDVAALTSGVVVALILRHGQIFGTPGEHFLRGGAVLLTLQIVFGTLFGNYRGRFAVGRFAEAGVVAAVQILVVLSYIVTFTLAGSAPLGRATAAMAAYWALVPMLGARYLYRYWCTRRVPPPSANSRRVFFYGAGNSAQHVVADLLFDPTSLYRPVGLIDDAASLRNRSIAGVSVIGTSDELSELAARYRVGALLLAGSSADPERIQKVGERAHRAGLDVIVLASAEDHRGARQLNPGEIPLVTSER
jgi:lipopolysaccharide/colanic/teichoic acid biosynthesis glycosyltransferase